MLILALDTTTGQGSCALVRDGVRVAEQTSLDHAHAVHLPGDLMNLLSSRGVSLAEIDGFAVAVGPGSFTGLRIGIATMQGLAFAEGKPLYGISALDALAQLAAPQAMGRKVIAWIDAWRGEVYHAIYGTAPSEPVVDRPESVLDTLPEAEFVFTGDGAATHRDLIDRWAGGRAVVTAPIAPALAGAVGVMATAAAVRGDQPQPDAIRPLYVRRSYAEPSRDGRRVI